MAYRHDNMNRRDLLKAGSGIAAAVLVPSSAIAAVDATTVARTVNSIELTSSMLTTASVELRRTNSKARVRSLEVGQVRQGTSDLSLRRFSFLSPADISGTKLLVHENSTSANDLWLLLPSIGKPRRISASKQSNSFAGTDFSYADMMSLKVDNFEHQITASNSNTVTLDSQVKSASYGKEIGYSRSVVIARAGSFVPQEIQYFDSKGALMKTQILSGAVKSPDGAYVIKNRRMVVHKNGNETLISLGSINFQSGLDSSDFKSQRL